MKKYIFQEDFDKTECDPADEFKFTERDIIVIKEKALEEGIQIGRNQEKQEIDAQLIHSLIGFQDNLIRFVDEEGESRRQLQYQAAQLAKSIAIKICVADCQNHAVDRVVSCMDSVTKNLLGTPKITLKVNSEIGSALSTRIQEMIQGHLVEVVMDDSIDKTDCQIQWADGSAESILEKTVTEIDSILEETMGPQHLMSSIKGDENDR